VCAFKTLAAGFFRLGFDIKNLAHSKMSTFSKHPRAGTQTDRLDALNTMASVVVARNAPVTSYAAAKDGTLPQIVSKAAVAKLYRYALVRGHQRTKGDALTRQLKLKTTEMRKSRWELGGCTSITFGPRKFLPFSRIDFLRTPW
jgi:hypothetical protein